VSYWQQYEVAEIDGNLEMDFGPSCRTVEGLVLCNGATWCNQRKCRHFRPHHPEPVVRRTLEGKYSVELSRDTCQAEQWRCPVYGVNAQCDLHVEIDDAENHVLQRPKSQ